MTNELRNTNEITQKEKDFYNSFWNETQAHSVEGSLIIPQIDSLSGKRVLICSCGAGFLPVLAAKQGADVYAFDISETAVEKAREMAEFNNVSVNASVMDFHALQYPDHFFDVIYGRMILHHIDCKLVSKELFRCLKPGGVACFDENSDRNPVLRFFRRALFGKPGEVQKSKFLFFKRGGTSDEYPLMDEEIAEFEKVFGKENVRLFFPSFLFFQCLYAFGLKRPIVERVTAFCDNLIARLVPGVRKFSFLQTVWIQKQSA